MKAQRKEQVSGMTVKVIKKTPLTKAEMVNKIQLTEAAMFLELKKAEKILAETVIGQACYALSGTR